MAKDSVRPSQISQSSAFKPERGQTVQAVDDSKSLPTEQPRTTPTNRPELQAVGKQVRSTLRTSQQVAKTQPLSDETFKDKMLCGMFRLLNADGWTKEVIFSAVTKVVAEPQRRATVALHQSQYQIDRLHSKRAGAEPSGRTTATNEGAEVEKPKK